jgi:hypothetical protein
METKEKETEEQPETQEEPQILTVKLPLNEWGAILSAIQQSSAPFIQVNAILNELDRQLKPQVKDDKP